jgi:predicted permease
VALGAGRSRLARQLLTESLAFTAIGGTVGCALAQAGMAAVTAVAGPTLTGWRHIDMGNSTLAFAVGVSVISALLFGLAPVVQSLRSSPVEAMRDCGRGDSSATQPRLRSALVIGQTAVAVALGISAALLLQSYSRMRTLRTGIRTEGLITASLRLPDSRYGMGPERARFYDDLLGRLRDIPGVRVAGATSALQLESKGEGSMTWPEGGPIDAKHPPIVKNRNISPDYFRVLGIPLVAGRGFSQADDATAPKVMLVNESFARTYYPAGQAIGRRVTYTSEHVTAQIVGIVADVRPRMIDAAPQPEMYFPYMQRSRHEMALVLRSSLPLAVLERAMRKELSALDPEQALYDVRTMDEVMSDVLSRPRFTTSMVAFFSAAALLLAAIGIYGVLSFTVSRRSREIAIRLALGAQTGEIRAMVVGYSLKVVAVGIAIGIPLSLGLARFSATLLFGVTSGDPLTMVLVASVVLGVGWLAAFLPARRAARVDPMRALQSD